MFLKRFSKHNTDHKASGNRKTLNCHARFAQSEGDPFQWCRQKTPTVEHGEHERKKLEDINGKKRSLYIVVEQGNHMTKEK